MSSPSSTNCQAELDRILALAERHSPYDNGCSSATQQTVSYNCCPPASPQPCPPRSPQPCPPQPCPSPPQNHCQQQQCQPHELAPAWPLDKYKLHDDHCPEIVTKRPCERVHYTQNVAVRYLKPPAPAPGGDIVITQLPDRQVAPAPPLHVTKQQPSRPTPPPLVLREAPPPPPPAIPGQCHHVPGKIIPPPNRKVITEHLPPCPPKPQQVVIDRWLPYDAPQQRVVYKPAKPPCLIPNPRNVTIVWCEPEVDVSQCFVNLGVHCMDPREYCSRYGSSLISADQLPEVAVNFGKRGGHCLAADRKQNPKPVLYGDVEYLRLVNGGQQNGNNCNNYNYNC